MIRKLNKYLIENHPLVWNTRLVWMLMITIVLHLVFYLIGFFSYLSPAQLHETSFFKIYLFYGFVWFGILLSILLFILWLNQYFKNNAFKEFYPKSNFSLYKEFLIVFLISFLNIAFYFSYTEGLRQRISLIKTNEEIIREVNVLNRIAPFTLQYDNSYSNQGRDLPVPVFDTLVDKSKVVDFHIDKLLQSEYWQKKDSLFLKKYKDSISEIFYQLPEFENELIYKFPERLHLKNIFRNSYSYYDNLYSVDTVSVETVIDDDSNIKHNLASIYNFNRVYQPNLITKSNIEYAQLTHQLLNNRQKDSIQYWMDEFTKLAKEYEIPYRFQKKKWMDYVYNPPYYFVDYELRDATVYDKETHLQKEKDFVNIEGLDTVLKNLNKSKSILFGWEHLNLFLYIALSLALLIYTFRITSIRVWIISVIGGVIVSIIFGAIMFCIGMFYNYTPISYAAAIVALLFILFFNIIAWTGIFQQRYKTVSGVNLIWSIITAPFIALLFASFYQEYILNNYSHYENGVYIDLGKKFPVYGWINENFDIVFCINVIFFLIFLALYIPLIKKWKAMPEE